MQPRDFTSPLRKIGRYLLRYRKTKGYGVHSPHAYGFLREVILQHGRYYAYAPLRRQYLSLDPEEKKQSLSLKECKLLFRLANDLQAEEAYLLHCSTGIEEGYLRAARSHIRIHTQIPRQAETNQPAPRLFVVQGRTPDDDGLNETITRILPLLHSTDCLLVSRLQQSARRRKYWRQWAAHPAVGIAFDLYTAGILLGKDGEYRRTHIRINF